MIALSFVSVACIFIPISVYVLIEKISKNVVYQTYDFLVPVIITLIYSFISAFIYINPKTLSNFSVELSLLSISLVIYGLNALFTKAKTIAKITFTLIPLGILILVLFFSNTLLE